jgi:hypothetical protein
MPDHLFPVPQFRSYPTRTSRHPGFVLRMRTRWRRNRLDEELSHGADPAASAELTLRAMQLRSPATRVRFANTLAEISRDARRLEALTVDVAPQRVAIRDCSEGLLALVGRLVTSGPSTYEGWP